jgi:PTH1 family peptidyl-tRNA hydrolase
VGRRYDVAEFAWRTRFAGRLAIVPSHGMLLLMPQTYMNESGASVAPCAAYYDIPPQRILVVCDDINLPFGRLRLRRAGSDGGHNGLKSVIAALGTQDFPRLRVGIGRPQDDAVEYVTGRFSAGEEESLPEIIERAVQGVETFVNRGIEDAIAVVNAYGGGPAPPKEEPAPGKSP